jgi:hypothetical protein
VPRISTSPTLPCRDQVMPSSPQLLLLICDQVALTDHEPRAVPPIRHLGGLLIV